MRKPSLLLISLLTGAVLLLAAAGVLSRRHDSEFGVDAGTYYIAARTLMSGGNPYLDSDMLRTARLVDPAGLAVNDGGVQAMANLPASILPFAPLSLLPIRAYDWFLIALSAFCLPLAIGLSARLARVELSGRMLAGLSILAGCFPPFWRSLVVGQPVSPILACLLAACWYGGARSRDGGTSRRGQIGAAAGFSLLGLVKATCSLPLAGWLLLTGSRATRVGVGAALAIFAGLNGLLAAHIGVHAFVNGYRSVNALFSAVGGVCDPYTGARNARIDLQPALALFTPRRHIGAVTAACSLLLASPLAVAALRRSAEGRSGRRDEGGPLDLIAAVLALSLLITYHRPYDAVLALPMLVLIVQDWRGGKIAAAVTRGLALAVAAGVLGDHSVQGLLQRHDPGMVIAWVRPAAVIGLYLSVVLPMVWARTGAGSGGRAGEQEPSLPRRRHSEMESAGATAFRGGPKAG